MLVWHRQNTLKSTHTNKWYKLIQGTRTRFCRYSEWCTTSAVWRPVINKCSTDRGRWVLSPASHSYVLTNFRSDQHVGQCWLAECTVLWFWFQHSDVGNLNDLIAADISLHQWKWTITSFASSESTSSSLFLCFSLWGTHGGQSLAFRAKYLFCNVLIVWRCYSNWQPSILIGWSCWSDWHPSILIGRSCWSDWQPTTLCQVDSTWCPCINNVTPSKGHLSAGGDKGHTIESRFSTTPSKFLSTWAYQNFDVHEHMHNYIVLCTNCVAAKAKTQW